MIATLIIVLVLTWTMAQINKREPRKYYRDEE